MPWMHHKIKGKKQLYKFFTQDSLYKATLRQTSKKNTSTSSANVCFFVLWEAQMVLITQKSISWMSQLTISKLISRRVIKAGGHTPALAVPAPQLSWETPVTKAPSPTTSHPRAVQTHSIPLITKINAGNNYTSHLLPEDSKRSFLIWVSPLLLLVFHNLMQWLSHEFYTTAFQKNKYK